MSHYPLYLVESMGMPRNHHAIFVQAQDDGQGAIFNVIGNIQSGMSYEIRKTTESPKLSTTFISMSQLGWIKVDDLPHINSICSANPPPAKQFNGHKRISKNQPLRRCQEWTSETIGYLKAEGVLLDDMGSAAAGSASAGESSNTVGNTTGSFSAGGDATGELGGGETRDAGY